MPIDLINIDNLVLVNDFETWFDRTNEIIDALNPLQLYDFYDNFYATGDGVAPTIPGFTGLSDLTEATTLGLKITRDIRFDGDMLIEVFPEAPLGFNSVTGRLAFVFTGPNAPPLLGTSCSPPDRVEQNDLFIVHDFDANVTKIVEAEDMLPPIIKCDHQFGEVASPVTITIKGDLVVDGTQTILSTTNVASEDNNIELNALNALEMIDSTNYVAANDLIVGETVTGQTSGATATVVSWTPAPVGNPGSVLVVTNVAGIFVDGEVVLGGTSGFDIDIGSQAPPVPTLPAGNDTLANLGGICLLTDDLAGGYCIRWQNAGDRWFINDASWEIDQNFDLFTTTIETQTGLLDLQGGAGGPYPLTVTFRNTNDPSFPASDAHWQFKQRENNPPASPNFPYGPNPSQYPTGLTVGPPAVDAGTFILEHVDPVFATTSILFDSISLTKDPGVGPAQITGFARNLNADLLDGCHASEIPTPFFIPCADANGELDPGWIPFSGSVVKEINQTSHGLVKGNVVRPDPANADEYILAQADTLPNTESVGVVSTVIDVNTFELTLLGCVTGFDAVISHAADHSAAPSAGGSLVPGQAYFLSTGEPGAFTSTAIVPGEISKTVLIATSTTDAIIVNYVGGQTDPTGGSFAAFLTNDVFGSGTFVAGSLNIPVTIVERTQTQVAAGGFLPLAVEDSTGAGFRTFEISLTASTILELQEPSAAGWNIITTPDFHTNSVTLIITQDAVGGHTPTITISGGGTIIWDNSLTQPAASVAALKTSVYVLINSTNNPGVWYGSRAVLEL